MNNEGTWHLSPAFDIIFAHNPAGVWTNQHQMTINGKRSGFSLSDLISVGTSINIPRPMEIIEEVNNSVEKWEEFAAMAGIEKTATERIKKFHRTKNLLVP
jgi:serine/threonine-protein kinase HipA